MVLPQSRITLHDQNGEALVLRVSPTRRLVFVVVSIVLLGAFLYTLDAERDLRGPGMFGAVFYFVLIGGSLAIAAYDDRKVFHRRRRELLIQSMLAGIPLHTRRVAFDDITQLTLQRRRVERPADGTIVGVPEGEAESGEPPPSLTGRKSVLYVLCAVTDDNTHTLESSSERADLEEVGRSLAQFLEVPFTVAES